MYTPRERLLHFLVVAVAVLAVAVTVLALFSMVIAAALLWELFGQLGAAGLAT